MAKIKFAFTPYPLQQEIIDHLDGKYLNKEGIKRRFFVVAIGRQAGKSWLAKYTILERAVNRRQRCMWVAPSIPTARGHWNELVDLIEKSGIPVKRLSQAAKEIQFADGGSISVRSAVEPDNLRGATLDFLVLDEAAFFRNGEYIWYSICLPMVTASQGDVLFTSTPNGRNWFWRLWNQGQNDNDPYYKSWRATSYASPYQDKRLLDELKKTMPEYQWLEEFMAEFLADSGGVFAGAEAAARIKRLVEPSNTSQYVAGIDFGFNHDATCFTVIDKNTREQVYGYRFFNRGTLPTIRKLIELLQYWQPETAYLERNGLGMPLFSLLQSGLRGIPLTDDLLAEVDTSEEESFENREFKTDWNGRIRALFMTNEEKRILVETCAADIEYGRLRLLNEKDEYGEIQLSEMSTYRRIRSADGLTVKYEAEEGSMDDTVSALYLACKGLPRPRPTIIKKDRSDDENIKKKNPFRGNNKLRGHRKGRKHA